MLALDGDIKGKNSSKIAKMKKDYLKKIEGISMKNNWSIHSRRIYQNSKVGKLIPIHDNVQTLKQRAVGDSSSTGSLAGGIKAREMFKEVFDMYFDRLSKYHLSKNPSLEEHPFLKPQNVNPETNEAFNFFPDDSKTDASKTSTQTKEPSKDTNDIEKEDIEEPSVDDDDLLGLKVLGIKPSINKLLRNDISRPEITAQLNQLQVDSMDMVHDLIKILKDTSLQLNTGSFNSLLVEDNETKESMPNENVDAVITFVNGMAISSTLESAKSAWLTSHPDWKNDSPGVAHYRFDQTQGYDLYHCVYSIISCMPWINTIIIVVESQLEVQLNICKELEELLKNSRQKIKIVEHSSFMPKEILPCFNSNVIESFLHCIPGISSKFIYFNDDLLVAKPLKYSDFFDVHGRPFIYFKHWSKNSFGGSSQYKAMKKNNLDVLQNIFKEEKLEIDILKVQPSHCCIAMTGLIAEKIETMTKKWIKHSQKNQFRDESDCMFTSLVYPLLSIAMDEAVQVEEPEGFFSYFACSPYSKNNDLAFFELEKVYAWLSF